MNAKVKRSNQEAVLVPGFGKVSFDKDTIANIFGFSDLKKRYRIIYDSSKEDASIVHKENTITSSSNASLKGYTNTRYPRLVYKKDMQVKQQKDGTSNLISTVIKNRKGYTIRQFEYAKEASKLYHMVQWVHRLLWKFQGNASYEYHQEVSCNDRRRQYC